MDVGVAGVRRGVCSGSADCPVEAVDRVWFERRGRGRAICWADEAGGRERVRSGRGRLTGVGREDGGTVEEKLLG
jgi:hypothetical protein